MDNTKIIEEVIKYSGAAEGQSVGYSALTLAYIGDCVYEMYVRSHLIKDANHKVNDLHRAATKFVCAKAQAEFYHRVKEILTEEEGAAFRRGRNAKSHPPKNADVIDYKIATGVEAMLGYLCVKGEVSRISELMKHLFE